MPPRELSRPPAMLPLFARAGAALVPGASRLPFIAGGGGDIPDLTFRLSDVAVDPERLEAYERVSGFATGGPLPASYPHILAFPLHLALMSDGSFPVPALGLVHIANRIVQHRPLAASERLSLRVWATALEPHPRGRKFSIRTEARSADELVWEEVSTILRREQPSAPELPPPPSASPPPAAIATNTQWRLDGDLGRRYARASGDLNPIHLHPLSARLFGFPSAIAHGMWTKARCLAALAPALPRAFSVDAEFRKPIRLPATVAFTHAEDAGTTRFAVRDAARGTPHLDGVLSPR
ncbi:MAG: hypothetical protein JO153_07205 [Solirubrobacterales bacterium]|nr:hypothetical protein [Solirubrobacterales bacterium]